MIDNLQYKYVIHLKWLFYSLHLMLRHLCVYTSLSRSDYLRSDLNFINVQAHLPKTIQRADCHPACLVIQI